MPTFQCKKCGKKVETDYEVATAHTLTTAMSKSLQIAVANQCSK
jgi:hypothetical protein